MSDSTEGRSGGARESKPERGSEHERLEVFVGTWVGEGRISESGDAMLLWETYEWVPGRFFLAHRFDRRVGASAEHRGFGFVEVDASGGYAVRLVDNMGYSRVYRLTERDGVWTFDGERERATYTFGDGGATMTASWEHAPDGAVWAPLCEFTSRKLT